MSVESKLDKVLDRIKKILSLSENNPSEEEAVTAAKMARTLLAKYDLSISDVKGRKDEPEEAIVTKAANYNKRVKTWEGYLANTMSEYVPVRSVILACKIPGKSNRRKNIQFIGHEADVRVAVEMYRYLRSTIKKMSRNRFTEKRLRKSYSMGAVHRLGERFKELKQQDVEGWEGKFELVVADKLAKIDDFLSDWTLKEGRSRRLSVDAMAESIGYQEADYIGLSDQVGSGDDPNCLVDC